MVLLFDLDVVVDVIVEIRALLGIYMECLNLCIDIFGMIRL